MEIKLEINNIIQSPVEDKFFVMVAKKTFAELKYNFLKNKEINISLALVTPEEIKKLNKQYRKYDSVTDVLSFPEYENIGQIEKVAMKNPESSLFLGELILCYDDIKEYADKEGFDPAGELANVTAHGILHLLGFTHGEEMFKIQNRVKDCLI